MMHAATVASHAIRLSGTRIFSRPAMTPALTPAQALAWLASLSIDVRRAAILDAEGRLLAGDPALASSSAAAPGADPPGTHRLRTVRSARHAFLVEAGEHALEGLLDADLRAALRALEDR
jgi:hypothetical protein